MYIFHHHYYMYYSLLVCNLLQTKIIKWNFNIWQIKISYMYNRLINHIVCACLVRCTTTSWMPPPCSDRFSLTRGVKSWPPELPPCCLSSMIKKRYVWNNLVLYNVIICWKKERGAYGKISVNLGKVEYLKEDMFTAWSMYSCTLL